MLKKKSCYLLFASRQTMPLKERKVLKQLMIRYRTYSPLATFTEGTKSHFGMLRNNGKLKKLSQCLVISSCYWSSRRLVLITILVSINTTNKMWKLKQSKERMHKIIQCLNKANNFTDSDIVNLIKSFNYNVGIWDKHNHWKRKQCEHGPGVYEL